jgi:hypothetical protein
VIHQHGISGSLGDVRLANTDLAEVSLEPGLGLFLFFSFSRFKFRAPLMSAKQSLGDVVIGHTKRRRSCDKARTNTSNDNHLFEATFDYCNSSTTIGCPFDDA